jgi:molybdenum cofactor cytidylyltransferase
MLTVIVLAAGLSSRMGAQNKLRLPFGEKTILQTTLQHIIDADLGEILVIVGHEKELIESDLALFKNKIKIVFNPHFESGMTSSIQAGVANSDENMEHPDKGGTEGYMICLSDMPLLQPIDYQRISNFYLNFREKKDNTYPIIQPVFNQQRGNPVIFHPIYKKEILDLQNTEGGKPIVQKHKENVHFVEMQNDAILLDADTPDAYAEVVSHRIIRENRDL